MNSKELAALLNGREYRKEITKYEEQLAKENNLLVVFGASDDLVEFRGTLYEEENAWRGTSVGVKFSKKIGRLKLCKVKKAKCVIDAEWSPYQLDCSWLITANVPYEPFDIFEDGELYCRGMVIDCSVI